MSLVILVSGGLDSTLMSLLAHEEGIEIFPLFIDYGQLCAEKEWQTCRRMHAKHRLPQPVFMNLQGYGNLIPSGITDAKLRINEDAFLPGRNLLLIIAGAGYAYYVKANGVAIGLLNEKDMIFPDQSSKFLKECEKIIKCAVGWHIRVVAPLITLSKQEVIEMAIKHGIEGTYSCHSGKEKPCGVCVSCVETNTALKKLKGG